MRKVKNIIIAEVQKNVNLNFVAVIKRAPSTTSKMHIKKANCKEMGEKNSMLSTWKYSFNLYEKPIVSFTFKSHEIIKKTLIYTEFKIKKKLKKSHNSKLINESLSKLTSHLS